MDMGDRPLPHPSELHKEYTTGTSYSGESGGIEVVDTFGP